MAKTILKAPTPINSLDFVISFNNTLKNNVLQNIRYFVEEYVERLDGPHDLGGYCTYSAGLTCYLLQKIDIPIYISHSYEHCFCKAFIHNNTYIIDLTATQFEKTADMPIVFIPKNHRLSQSSFYKEERTFNTNKELVSWAHSISAFPFAYSNYFFNVKRFLKMPRAKDLIKKTLEYKWLKLK